MKNKLLLYLISMLLLASCKSGNESNNPSPTPVITDFASEIVGVYTGTHTYPNGRTGVKEVIPIAIKIVRVNDNTTNFLLSNGTRYEFNNPDLRMNGFKVSKGTDSNYLLSFDFEPQPSGISYKYIGEVKGKDLSFAVNPSTSTQYEIFKLSR